MNSSLRASLCAVSLLVTIAASPARAGPSVEVMPFVGARLGGGFDVANATTGDVTSADLEDGGSYGVHLGLYANDSGFYELLYSTQQTSLDARDPAADGVDVTIDYLQVGGTALFPNDRFYVPYVSFTLGATFLEPRQGNYDSETKFSGSLGGGFRFPLGEHASIVLGLRGYLTLLDSDTDLFCASGAEEAVCLVKSSGSTFFQAEGQLGFSVAF
jgi:hypothetical protein